MDEVEWVKTIVAPSIEKRLWNAFVKYAGEHGRSSDITKQKASGRTYYHVHIGANGYHLFFSIPYGKRIKMGIYTYNVDTYNRLKESKDQIEAEFGEFELGIFEAYRNDKVNCCRRKGR